MHAYTRKLLDQFKVWGWRPKVGQLVVADTVYNSRLATALDLVMIDATGAEVAVEIKSGYHGYWDQGSDFLNAPLATVRNCPLNHAQLQLAMGVVLARGDVRVRLTKAFVVRVEEEGVFRYPLEPWAMDAVKAEMPFGVS